MLLEILLLLAGFTALILGADWLVNGASALARHYKISELAIGLTIVAFGTSSPELLVSSVSAVRGLNDVATGNIIGSNLFNVLLILGVSAMIYPLSVQIKTVKKEIPLSVFAAILLLGIANDRMFGLPDSQISRMDGLLLLIFFFLFLYYVYRNMKSEEILAVDVKTSYRPLYTIFLIVVGLAALILGSQLVVNNAVKIAGILGISEKVIGLTIVSAGTSLPELVTSALASFKRKSDIAIGNIIGSNIFNIFMILGISSLIKPIHYNTTFNLDIVLLILVSFFLLLAMFTGKKFRLDRWEGMVMFGLYLGYLIYLLK